MIRYQDILTVLAAVGMAWCASSCVTENIDGCPDDPASVKENRITLQFVVSAESAVTRANPEGGEEGNGREDEILNEARIHDVNVFLFADNSNLLNAASNTELTHLYFNLDDPGDGENTLSFEKTVPEDNSHDGKSKIVYTVTFLDEAPGLVIPLRKQGKVRFITIANLGKSMKGEKSKEAKWTLQDLWDYDNLTATWTGEGQDMSDGYDRFLMTTAYDDVGTDSFIDFNVGTDSGTGTESNPFRGKTTLQRMCARIDVMYDAANKNNAGETTHLCYGVENLNTAKVRIFNIIPVNVMKQPSYLFKKVTNGIPSVWTADISGHTWGGRETTDDAGVPSNYVLEPRTLAKLEEPNSTKLSFWYGDSRASVVVNSIKDKDKGKVGGYYSGTIDKNKNNGHDNLTMVSYANENTQSPGGYRSEFLTGLAFRAFYEPSVVYTGCDDDGNVTVSSVAEGEVGSIWRYSPSGAGTAASIAESLSLYFSDKDALDKYASLHRVDNAVVTEFTEGATFGGKVGFYCYYNLWLRHYDDVDDASHSDPHAVYPMQYATVRNNIYRVALKFNGPGDPTPTMREPETLQARIFVRKWNMREENAPLEF